MVDYQLINIATAHEETRDGAPRYSSIAIIDDLESNRSFLEHLAWREPRVSTVATFSSARDALAAFEQSPPDLVITDFHMPVMDAVEFLEQFRGRSDFEDVPVIVISARNESENRHRALLAGATDFLMVPFDPVEFQARTHNLLTLSLHQKRLRLQSRSLRSELQETRHQSQETQHRFTSIIDSVPALVFAVNAAGQCVFANHYCFDLLGLSKSNNPGDVQLLADRVTAEPPSQQNATVDGATPIGKEVSVRGKDQHDHVFLLVPKVIGGSSRSEALTVYSGIEITQLKETEQSLRDAKDEAEGANRAKSAFLSNMTHEIRTPLNAIMGFSDAICSEVHGPIGNEIYTAYLEDIQLCARQLLAALDEILEFSQIEADRYEVHLSRFSLQSLLVDVRELTAQNLEAYRNTLDMEDAPELTLHSDYQKLKQVLLNLISNANKATRQGRIRLATEQQPGGMLTIDIADNGIGMDDEELEVARTEFGRAMTSAFVSDGQSGPGLGLPISMRLMTILGGDLTIQSQKHVGTKVRITLPIDAAGEPARSRLGEPDRGAETSVDERTDQAPEP